MNARRRLKDDKTIHSLLKTNFANEKEKWKETLKHILNVLFLEEWALAFCCLSGKLGDESNGNFLDVIVVLARYDWILGDHADDVKKTQAQHYLSQN